MKEPTDKRTKEWKEWQEIKKMEDAPADKRTKAYRIWKAIQENNIGDAIEVVAKPIAKAIGMEEDCEGCNKRKELLNFGDKGQTHDIEESEFNTLNSFFSSGRQSRFHNRTQAWDFVKLNNKYFPKYQVRKPGCGSCMSRMIRRVKPLWESNKERYGKI